MTRRWIALLAAVSSLAVLAPQVSAAPPERSVTLTALGRLEDDYAGPVAPVYLLNAAIAGVRTAAHLGENVLPALRVSTPEATARDQFVHDLMLAVRMSSLPLATLDVAATNAMLAFLHNSHTFYLAPDDLDHWAREREGTDDYSWIGAALISATAPGGTTWTFVDYVIPGSPAERAGLRRFDRILSAGGHRGWNVSPEALSVWIRGRAGTTVLLVVERRGRVLTVPVTRGVVRQSDLVTATLRGGTFYARVTLFSMGIGFALQQALQAAIARHAVTGVVLDLRGNPGGLVMSATYLAGLFLPRGTVLARTFARGQAPRTTVTQLNPDFPTLPVAVLVDHGSASASELVAQAFHDARRAVLVGDRTAGALEFSQTADLPIGGMSVAVERVTGPRWEVIEGRGVRPDVEIPLTFNDMAVGRDTQMARALVALGQPALPAAVLLHQHRVRPFVSGAIEGVAYRHWCEFVHETQDC